MKHIFTLSLLLLVTLSATAQDNHCATELAMKRAYDRHPGLKAKMQLQNQQGALQAGRTATVASSYVIPIVFHIMHLGGPENVSDAQIVDAVRILNRVFGKQNPDTTEIIPAFKNLADSAGIRFVLAKLDPAGNCTNGIIHHYSTDTDWSDTSATIYSFTWDPTMYLNVYIVRSITLGNGFPAAGYTYYPGTWMTGDNWDAIVVLNNYMGSIGTSSSFLSRVLTHETGHWFNLAHIFGYFQTAGIDCSDDDFVMDTPPSIGHLTCPNPAIPSQYQTCTPGVSENFQNYMDYSYCCRMFTQGQCQRMQTAVQSNVAGRSNLWSNNNLLATGVISPAAPCAPVANFKYSRSKVCVGAPVNFYDASTNGAATSYSWSFMGGSPATSGASVQAVTYSTPGVYSVIYTVTNAAGTDVEYKTNIITVVSNTTQYTNTWADSFESATTFTNDWTIGSSSGSGQWERSPSAAYTGLFSAKISRIYNTRKNVSSMTGPAVNLAGVGSPVLTFKVAAAESVPHLNTLRVLASTDCGVTWTQIYNKTSPTLITSTATNPDFVPTAGNQWRTEAVSLSGLSPASYVNFKFEYVRDTIASANNIYVEDINITSATALPENLVSRVQDLAVFPNPSKGDVNVSFSLLSAQKVRFVLSDVLGRELQVLAEREFEAGNQTGLISLEDQAPGVYFLKMEVNGATYTRKLLME